jgi:hypothetical protein
MKIRGVRANNYSFTKALAEALVDEQMDNLPVIIQRPSAGNFPCLFMNCLKACTFSDPHLERSISRLDR